MNISRENGFGIKQENRALDLEEKAIISLMFKFLKEKNMDVVLSILLPAVGMNSQSDILSDQGKCALDFCFFSRISDSFYLIFNCKLRVNSLDLTLRENQIEAIWLVRKPF